MSELLSFDLEAGEVCKGPRGYAMTKVWFNIAGGHPKSKRFDLARRTLETSDPDTIIGDVLNKVDKDRWEYVIGFTVLRFCREQRHEVSRFERLASFAFVDPKATPTKIRSLEPYHKNDGVCRASIEYSPTVSGILYSVVDFPTTTYEQNHDQGLTAVEAAAAQHMVHSISTHTNVVLRSSVITIEGQAGVA